MWGYTTTDTTLSPTTPLLKKKHRWGDKLRKKKLLQISNNMQKVEELKWKGFNISFYLKITLYYL